MPDTSNTGNLARRVIALENESYKQRREQLDVLGQIQKHVGGIPFVQQQLESLNGKVDRLNDKVDKLNGTVRQNCDRLTKLESTALRIDAAKVSGVLLTTATVIVAVLKMVGVW